MTFIFSDLLKEIGSLNEQPRPIADQTVPNLPLGNEGPPVLNLAYPPRPAPDMTPMPPAPIFNRTGATTYDLDKLLPSQMGIIHANPAVLPTTNYDGRPGWYVNFNDVASQGWAPRGTDYEMVASDELMDDAPFIYPNGIVNAEMLSLWSEASATFR